MHKISFRITLLSLLGILGILALIATNRYLQAVQAKYQDAGSRINAIVRQTVYNTLVVEKFIRSADQKWVDHYKDSQNSILESIKSIQAISIEKEIVDSAAKLSAVIQEQSGIFDKVVANILSMNQSKADLITKINALGKLLTSSVADIDAEATEMLMQGEVLDPVKGNLRVEYKTLITLYTDRLLNITNLFLKEDEQGYQAVKKELLGSLSLQISNTKSLVGSVADPELTQMWGQCEPIFPVIDQLEEKAYAAWLENQQLEKRLEILIAEAERNSNGIETLTRQIILKNSNAGNMISVIVSLATIAALILSSFFIARAIIQPINNTIIMFKDIAQGEGDLTKRLEVTGHDEISQMAQWFNTFLDNLREIIAAVKQNSQTLNTSSTGLTQISGKINQATGHTVSLAQTVAAAAEEMSANMASVAAAMEESSTNLNTVAAASEQMSATVNEIARNTEQARAISQGAVSKAAASGEQMDGLGQAALAIGNVVETITEISEQVNLLSLNATIEAARAGEAGKGFAVVANEIKELAKQTAKASQDIKDKILGIQNSAENSRKGMTEISEVIEEVNNIVAAIAAAVQEQSASSMEISQNISQASSGIDDVNQNITQSSSVAADITRDISSVNEAVSGMAEQSNHVNDSSQTLAGLASHLGEMVNRFKI